MGRRIATTEAMIKRWLGTVKDTRHRVRHHKGVCIQNNVSHFLCITMILISKPLYLL